jgi:hypothetical protein
MFETFRRQTLYSEVAINTVIGGSSDPVLLHGYPQNLAMWARVAPILATTPWWAPILPGGPFLRRPVPGGDRRHSPRLPGADCRILAWRI